VKFLKLPDRSEERAEGQSTFQGQGPIEAKDRYWATITALVWGPSTSSLLEERRWISWSPWRGFCGRWEVFGVLHYITLHSL